LVRRRRAWQSGEEANVTNRAHVFLASLAGAAVGALVGYLYLTDSGRRLRSQIEPRLDDAVREMARLRQTIGKAQAAAAEGWRSLNELAGNSQRGEWGTPRQSSPF
jgi:gas vesicle protein